ncbi:MAG: hypothetical protein ACP5I1_00080 [Candidatus Hinthialibacter sp.]
MESVLKSIATSAYLDRVLFSPALKKLYFDMAVASGGVTQFKHVDGSRKGLSFAADKADDKKSILLFCAAHELMYGYDLLIQIAAQMLPVVVLALRSGTPDYGADIWTPLHLRDVGWLQFYTHTLQEAYDHLALAYHMNAAEGIRMPVVVLHSSLSHGCLGRFTPREDLDMGNPLTGLATTRFGKKMSLEEAIAKMKRKSEKATLRKTYENIASHLRDLYATLGYETPEKGLPTAGRIPDGDKAIISLIPAHSPEDADRICRPLCYRPFAQDSLIDKLKNKKVVAVVEPRPAPGSTPVFRAEIGALLGEDFQGRILSHVFPPTVITLRGSDLDAVEEAMK